MSIFNIASRERVKHLLLAAGRGVLGEFRDSTNIREDYQKINNTCGMESVGFNTEGVGQCDFIESTPLADYYAKSYMGFQ